VGASSPRPASVPAHPDRPPTDHTATPAAAVKGGAAAERSEGTLDGERTSGARLEHQEAPETDAQEHRAEGRPLLKRAGEAEPGC
jgi:hypothetical protein